MRGFEPRLPGGSLKIIAAKSPRNLRRHNVRILLMDEVDAMEAGVEGSPITLAERRTLSFANRKIILGSTPMEDLDKVKGDMPFSANESVPRSPAMWALMEHLSGKRNLSFEMVTLHHTEHGQKYFTARVRNTDGIGTNFTEQNEKWVRRSVFALDMNDALAHLTRARPVANEWPFRSPKPCSGYLPAPRPNRIDGTSTRPQGHGGRVAWASLALSTLKSARARPSRGAVLGLWPSIIPF